MNLIIECFVKKGMKMNKYTFIRFILLLQVPFVIVGAISAYSADITNDAKRIDIEAEKQRAIEAIKDFAGTLKAELQKALQEGGAINAITVCNSKAGLIAQDISRKRNLSIERVSLKNRNPKNSPSEWQKQVLKEFEIRKKDGEPISKLTYSSVAEIGNNKQFRYMKAIPTGPICLQCHGTNISDEVKKRLDQLYPDDKARGFKPGDIRGAFVVTSDLSS